VRGSYDARGRNLASEWSEVDRCDVHVEQRGVTAQRSEARRRSTRAGGRSRSRSPASRFSCSASSSWRDLRERTSSSRPRRAASTVTQASNRSGCPRSRSRARARRGQRPRTHDPRSRVRFHWLRHTAISLMARAGMKAELIAERVDHNDGGALIYGRYRHLFPSEVREGSLDARPHGRRNGQKRRIRRLDEWSIGGQPMPRSAQIRMVERKNRMGGTGLEPVTPSLSSRGDRSRPFAPVRPTRTVRRFRLVDRTSAERERTTSAAIAATSKTATSRPVGRRGILKRAGGATPPRRSVVAGSPFPGRAYAR
jgi:hypothetical protein